MRLVPVIALILLALVPATASAGEVWIDRSTTPMTVVFQSFPGETNTVDAHFALSGHWVDVYDQTAPLVTTDTACTIVRNWQAHCNVPLASNVSLSNGAQLYADLGDGNDSFQPTSGTAPYEASVYGDAGSDQITLGRNQDLANSVAYGGDGNDVFHSSLQPGDTRNFFYGNAGDDIFVTLNGALDAITCGDGIDSVRADTADGVDGTCENVTQS